MTEDDAACQSDFSEYAYCFESWLDQESQRSCEPCVDLVTDNAFNIIDTTGERFVAPRIECVQSTRAVCTVLESSCLWESCGPCAFYYQPYLLCRLDEESAARRIGCTFQCDGSRTDAARPTSHPATAPWVGFVVALALARWVVR
jgi:hypothetical protein